jgi:hypothetical protein
MLSIGVRIVNAGDLRGLVKTERRKLENRIAGSMSVSVNEWRKLVISSTWFNPRPSPTDQVVGFWRKEGRDLWRLTFGWINYRGSAARAQWRLSLREFMYSPKVIARLERAIRGPSGQGGRG